uniref:Uncharacterized protein n=1 Tax=Oryza nivara TaxID=4536 RepID=A0A0E0FGY9_ORYNI
MPSRRKTAPTGVAIISSSQRSSRTFAPARSPFNYDNPGYHRGEARCSREIDIALDGERKKGSTKWRWAWAGTGAESHHIWAKIYARIGGAACMDKAVRWMLRPVNPKRNIILPSPKKIEKKTYFVGQLLLAHPPVPTLPARRRRRDLAVGVASHPRIAGGGGGPAPPYPTYDVIAMRQLRRPMLASPPLPLPASPPHGTPVSGAAAAACCNDDAWSASESATIDLHRRSQLSSTSGSLWYRTCSLTVI